MRIVSLLAVVIACGAVSVRAEDTASLDLAQMNGTWEVVEFIAQGNVQEQPQEISFQNGVMNFGGYKYNIVLNGNTNPRQIDLKFPGRTQYSRGIFENSRGEMRISFGPTDVDPNNPEARPRTFNTDNTYYSHLKLRKKAGGNVGSDDGNSGVEPDNGSGDVAP